MYAIYKFAKLNDPGQIQSSSDHMIRARPTPNANPNIRNKVLIGSADPVADVNARLAINTHQRKNSVLAVEVLVTASPEFFEQATKEQKLDWVRTSKQWLIDTYGQENICHLELHLDESTPHLTGFMVPIDPATGKLNCSKWHDGRVKCSNLQTSHWNSVKHLGLERGVEKSDISYEDIKKFKAALKVPIEAATKEELEFKARAGIMAERKVKQYQKNAQKYREETAAARDVPMVEVLEMLGLKKNKHDKDKWNDENKNFSISITGNKFFDHQAEKGGGGAIDLVMHLLEKDFKDAVSWLGHRVGVDRTAGAVTAKTAYESKDVVRQAMAEKPAFTPPTKATDLGTRKRVSDYLTKERGLDAQLIKAQNGRVYADERANAVFLASGSDGKVLGAEMRGSGSYPFHGFPGGSDREACFLVETQDQAQATSLPSLVLVESGIDALSYAQLHSDKNLVVASAGSARPSIPASLLPRMNEFADVIVGYDNDHAGNKSAGKIIEALRALGKIVSRHLPSFGKDWNNVLINERDNPPILFQVDDIQVPSGTVH